MPKDPIARDRINALDRLTEARFRAFEKAVDAALAAAKEAVLKSENAYDKRFDGVNEMRGMVRDQAVDFAKADAVDVRFKALEEKVNALVQAASTAAGKGQGADYLWRAVQGGLGLLIAGGMFFLVLKGA